MSGAKTTRFFTSQAPSQKFAHHAHDTKANNPHTRPNRYKADPLHTELRQAGVYDDVEDDDVDGETNL